MTHIYKLNIDTDLPVLYRQGLLREYKTSSTVIENGYLKYMMARPTTFGILLYAAAHNKKINWRAYSHLDFSDFEDIPPPMVYATSLEALKKDKK